MSKYKVIKIATIIVYIIAILSTAYLYSIERVSVCDYVSINGDFQSYNVFRRILDGQIPYVDFANYIGMAPIFINLPLLFFSNTFASSLFITNFTSCIVFFIVVFVIFYLITKNLYLSLGVSAFLPKIISSQILTVLLGPKYGYILTQRFTDLFTPSNSMRSIRSFSPILLVILAILSIIIYKKITHKEVTLIKLLNSSRALFIIGLVQGLFIVWSNDFGFATIAAAIVTFVALDIFYYKNRFKKCILKLFCFIAGAFIGLVVITSVITMGHPFSWVKAILDTAQYQHFYFSSGGPILPYIFSNTVLLAYTSLFCIILFFNLYLLIQKKITDSHIYLVFIGLSILAATYIYILGGSGYNLREPLEVYLILYVTAYFAYFIFYLLRKYTHILNFILIGLLCVFASYVAMKAITFTPTITGQYSEELGGTTTYTKAIFEAKDYVGDEEIFSLYSTGLEVALGQYQPTGYDYIIHALGEDVQAEYVATFLEGNYQYVQTPTYAMGAWLANLNWYFYRELLSNYTKDFETEYSWIWTKSDVEEIDAKVEYDVNIIDPYTVEINCTSDYKEEFITEFLVDYTTEFENFGTMIRNTGKKAVYIDSNIAFDESSYAGTNALGDASLHIPVAMKNGEGTMTITGIRGTGILLNVESVTPTGNYQPFYLY